MQKEIYFGDIWDIVQNFPNKIFNLIYFDPPFNSDKIYNMSSPYNDKAQQQAYIDKHEDFIKAENLLKEYAEKREVNKRTLDLLKSQRKDSQYLSSKLRISIPTYLFAMTPYLCECHRLLKSIGHIFIHCDGHANYLLRQLINCIFGNENFLNEIIWSYGTGGGGKKHLSKHHQTLFLYAKNEKESSFKTPKIDSPQAYKYGFDNLKNDGKSKTMSCPYKHVNNKGSNLIYSREIYLPDVWDDIDAVRSNRKYNGYKESRGFSTQKPRLLTSRMIESCCVEGDTVFEPFMGTGPLLKEAEEHKLNWIGIDISVQQVKNVEDFFKNCEYKLKIGNNSEDFLINGIPRDYESLVELAKINNSQFEKICNNLAYMVSTPHNNDGGIDGYNDFSHYDDKNIQHTGRFVNQISSAQNGNIDKFRALITNIFEKKAKFGIYIALTKPTLAMSETIIKYRNNFFNYRARPEGEIVKIPFIQYLALDEYYELGCKLPNNFILPTYREHSFESIKIPGKSRQLF